MLGAAGEERDVADGDVVEPLATRVGHAGSVHTVVPLPEWATISIVSKSSTPIVIGIAASIAAGSVDHAPSTKIPRVANGRSPLKSDDAVVGERVARNLDLALGDRTGQRYRRGLERDEVDEDERSPATPGRRPAPDAKSA